MKNKNNRSNKFKSTFIYNKIPYVITFIIPSVILLISYFMFKVWPFGERSVLVLDLNGQYVYYYEALKNAIFGDGSIFYSWSRNMSGDFFGLVGYYLASPFALIPTLLPRSIMTESILAMQVCKVGTAAVTFSYYLRKTNRSDTFEAVLFGTLYSLMSYVSVQLMNPMWIDGVIYLPLIILGIEELVKEKRILPFAIPLGLMFIANFYIGYMVGIFSALYFVFFAISEDCLFRPKKAFDRILRAGAGAVIAVLIGMVTVLPIIKVLSLGKMEFSTPPTFEAYEKFTVPELLGKLLPMTYDSVNVEGLPFVYCGILTILMFPLFFTVKQISLKKKLCYAGITVTSCILMYVSTFDLLMHGGQWPNWLNYRYSFILSFLILTFAAAAFNKLDLIERRNLFKVYGIIFAIIVIARDKWYSYIPDVKTLWFGVIALTLYLFIAVVIKEKPEIKKVCVVCCTVFVACELVFNTYDNFKKIDEEVLYSTRDSYTEWYDEFSPMVDYVKQNDDSLYRMDTTYHRTVNDPMALDIYGISHSSSLMNTELLNFLSCMGYTSRGFESRYIGGTVVSDSLIGMKYVISEWEDNTEEIKPKLCNQGIVDFYNDIYSNGYVLHIYENPYALPIAFYADDDLFLTEFDTDVENRVFENQNQLLGNIVGNSNPQYFTPVNYETYLNNVEVYDAVDQERYVPKDASFSSSVDMTVKCDKSGELYMFIPTNYHRSATVNVNGKVISNYFAEDYHTALCLGKFNAGEQVFVSLILNEEDLYMRSAQFYMLDTAEFSSAIEQIRANPSEVTMNNAASIDAKISAPNSGYIYTSIPYEKGWSVTVDGKRADTMSVANGLMAIPVSAGEHTVKFRYISDGFIPGLLLSVLGVGICIAIIVIDKKKIFKKSK